jgi:hypothetical protein
MKGKLVKWSHHVCRSVLFLIVLHCQFPKCRYYPSLQAHLFHKQYALQYLICITIPIMIRFIGNCNYSLKSMPIDMGAAMFYFYMRSLRPNKIDFLKKKLSNKCGHRNVLSKRQVWMSIFHIINFIKKKSWTQGSWIFLIKN